MGTKVSKTAIGAFVLGAIALLVAGVLVLGAGKFLTTMHSYITYFDGSVKGLNIGSPVMFQGVKVGEVTDIGIIADQRTHTMHIPVLFDIEPAKFKGTTAKFQHDPAEAEKAVKELGLRTQLQSLSFVTGQLMVALEFEPDTPIRYVGLDKNHIEIPSVPTPLEKLQKTLEDLPFKQIVENLNSAMQGINRLVSSIDAKKTTQTIEAAVRDVQALIRNLNEEIDPLAKHLADTSQAAQATLAETKDTMAEAKTTMAAARGNMQEVVASAKVTLDSAQAALKQSEVTLQAYSADSRLTNELNKTLRELSATSRSFRNLSDYLERHPESLLRGKPAAKGD